jgi:hypothetical protein
MPRKTLRAAAVSVLLAAGALPSAQADDRPTISRFSSSAKSEESAESASKPARRFFPFGKKSEAQPVDAGQPAISRFAAVPAKKAEPAAEAQPAKVSPFSKLKNAVGLNRKDQNRKDDSERKVASEPKPSGVTTAAHKASAPPKVTQASGAKSRQAAYDDDADVPPPALPTPGDPVSPPVPFAAGPSTAPAYEPLPLPSYSAGRAVLPGYPHLHAPLNPCPIPNVPYQVGSTIITNQALYPHEMQYPHEYRAMYPPFYYKVRGGWMVTPWGVMSHDRWELQGTEVKVKYRSNYSFHSMFHPPVIR